MRCVRTTLSVLLCLGCVSPRTRAVRSAPRTLRDGLVYRELACRVGDDVLHLRQLSMRQGHGLELRAFLNPTARTDPRCHQRYGGTDLRALAAQTEGFHVIAATNGNFFHRLPDGGFRSNGMIWSRGAHGAGALLAPVQPTVDPDFRGDHIFVADARGGHELRVATEACVPGACRVRVLPPPATGQAIYEAFAGRVGPMSEGEFVAALGAVFPTMTLAMQINQGYADPAPSASLAEAFRCTPARRWTCDPHPVTLLCAGADGSVSLLASEEAYYPNLPAGLRPGGACGTACALLYILDGGGSTQIGYESSDAGFAMQYAGRTYADAPQGCATYRPVDHYLGIGTPR